MLVYFEYIYKPLAKFEFPVRTPDENRLNKENRADRSSTCDA